MTQSNIEICKKWGSSEHLENIEKICKNQLAYDSSTSSVSEFDDLFFPIVKSVFAQTIGQDLVTVQPLSGGYNTEEELEKIKNEIKSENRDSKIESLLEDKEYNEKKIEEHPDYKKGPQPLLYYLDYKYKNDEDN